MSKQKLKEVSYKPIVDDTTKKPVFVVIHNSYGLQDFLKSFGDSNLFIKKKDLNITTHNSQICEGN